MRLSWYIYVPIMLSAVVITWHLRTKDMNFMPDTTVDEKVEVVEEPFVMVGPPAPMKVDQSALESGTTLLGLNHFSNYAENPEELIRVFEILRNKDTELAYLAGERLMEHTGISADVKREQASPMSRVAKSVEPYVFDLNESRPLNLTLSGIPPGLQSPVSKELSELIFTSSGGLVDPVISYENGNPSVSVTVNGVDSHSPLSENANIQEIVSGLYILLATEMNKKGFQLPHWTGASSDEFVVALTRLAWAESIRENVPETSPDTANPE